MVLAELSTMVQDSQRMEHLRSENLSFEPDKKAKKERASVLADGWPRYLSRSCHAIFMTSKVNVLLPCVPLAIVSHFAHGGVGAAGWTFTFALLGIAPLAERLGFVTEELANYTNQTLGGLLNASFGNATEMIVCIFALKSNQLRVVQLSLLGSILSNMLLVLGCAFFFGGLKFKEQRFNADGANANTGLLCLAVMGMSLPAVLHRTHTELEGTTSEIALSRFTSICLLGIYFSYLYFQLVTHTELFEDNEEEDENDDEEEEEESGALGFWGCIVWLGILTVFISILSSYLVDAIEGAAASWDMSVAFISTILLPIVGNAAEHASAIIFAMKNKMDVAIGVAVGSSTQIALLVFPFSVVLGWGMGRDMDLNLHMFEVATLFLTVVIVSFVVGDGNSNWLKGVTLVLAYVVIACSFFYHRDIDTSQGWPGANA